MNSLSSDTRLLVNPPPPLMDAEILADRPPRSPVDPWRPHAFLVEPEHTAAGRIEDVATIFLTNRECPFRCVFCDLWKYTTEVRVPIGAIPAQIDFALSRLPAAQHIKLYNSGNFFDRQAIPTDDYGAIAERVSRFRTVIVENHPNLCTSAVFEFRKRMGGELEVALGLETIHPEVLPRLNKRMTIDDFARAVGFLLSGGVHVRGFILLKPPFLDEQAGIDWALRSLEYALDLGVRCCSVIPTRAGNGIMDRLQADGRFSPPRLRSLEMVLEEGLRMARGRVLADLWDAERLATCPHCTAARIERLRQMNLQQQVVPPVVCDCE